MTTEMVREKFGEPESIETGPGLLGDSCWRYVHEEQVWMATLVPLLWPLWLVVAPIFAAVPSKRWDEFWVTRRPTLAHFQAEKLIYWELVGTLWYYEDRSGWEYSGVEQHWVWGKRAPYSGWDFLLDPRPEGSYDLSFSDLTCEAVENMRTTVPGGIPGKRMLTKNQVAAWSAPSTSSERKGFLNRDHPVRFLERKNQWCHVENASGSDAWIACVFLALSLR
jgi:hypothetical protein